MIKMLIIPVLVTALILFMFWLPYSDNEGGMCSRSLDLYKTLNRSGKKYAKKTGFYYMGAGAGSRDDEKGEKKYANLELSFQTNRTLSKSEGRKLLIEAAEGMKDTLNANKQLREHYLHNPMGVKNVSVTFFVRDKNYDHVTYPNYCVLIYQEGKLSYYTEKSVKDPSYFTKESETLEEAMELIKSEASSGV